MIKPLKEPDMSDFENRTGNHTNISPYARKDVYNARYNMNLFMKINEIIDYINKQQIKKG